VALPPLLFAAHGDQARSWSDVVRRSHAIELRAAIDLAAGGVEGLDRALAAWPDAAVAVWAAGPLEASRIAERLVARAAPSVLHPAPASAPSGSGVQVSHGWLTLAGVSAIEPLFTSRVEAVRLRARGLPEGPAPGLAPVVYHALALVLRFGRDVRVEHAVLEDEQRITIVLDVDRVQWRLELSARHGPELSLAVRTVGGDYAWSADAVSESLERPGAEPRAVPSVPWAERCLKQLAQPMRGASLSDASAVRALMDEVEQVLERRLPPIPPRVELVRMPMSASLAPPPPEVSGTFRAPPLHEITARRKVGLERLGLLGDVPAAAPLAPRAPPVGALPFEAIGYRLELRAAVFITTDLAGEERVRASLPGHVVRRERTVALAPDAWAEDGEKGEVRVELFAARDAVTAQKLADLSSAEPLESAQTIGALLGYPACCVQAFAAQADRSDNSYNRYAIAARTSWGPWVRVLDDTSLKLLPHFACTYRCERSKEQADKLLAELAVEDPALHTSVLQYLGGPVLYFDHDHQIRFDGTVSDGGIVYRSISIPWPGPDAFATLAGAIARGNRLVLGDRDLEVFSGEAKLFSLERTDPGLGIVLPFGR
jgi:hypothetical protein